MNSTSENRTAIITGAGRGIGRAIALKLAKQGIKVALAARTESELNETRALILDAGGIAESIVTDISDENSVRMMIDRTAELFGRLDIVVNNAGLGIYSRLEETPAADWDRIMSVNAKGTFLVCRECIRHLRKQPVSWIINISSVVGIKGYVNQAAYSASKHAVMGMTKTLAREVQPDGIRVHAICPGGVDTDMAALARPDIDRSALISAEDIANTAAFLLTLSGNAMIDEINIRRYSSTPWP